MRNLEEKSVIELCSLVHAYGASKSDLANRLGLSKGMITHIENGTKSGEKHRGNIEAYLEELEMQSQQREVRADKKKSLQSYDTSSIIDDYRDLQESIADAYQDLRYFAVAYKHATMFLHRIDPVNNKSLPRGYRVTGSLLERQVLLRAEKELIRYNLSKTVYRAGINTAREEVLIEEVMPLELKAGKDLGLAYSTSLDKHVRIASNRPLSSREGTRRASEWSRNKRECSVCDVPLGNSTFCMKVDNIIVVICDRCWQAHSDVFEPLSATAIPLLDAASLPELKAQTPKQIAGEKQQDRLPSPKTSSNMTAITEEPIDDYDEEETEEGYEAETGQETFTEYANREYGFETMLANWQKTMHQLSNH